jgi:hypothetical protein
VRRSIVSNLSSSACSTAWRRRPMSWLPLLTSATIDDRGSRINTLDETLASFPPLSLLNFSHTETLADPASDHRRRLEYPQALSWSPSSSPCSTCPPCKRNWVGASRSAVIDLVFSDAGHHRRRWFGPPQASPTTPTRFWWAHGLPSTLASLYFPLHRRRVARLRAPPLGLAIELAPVTKQERRRHLEGPRTHARRMR